MIEYRKIKIDHDTLDDYASEMFGDFYKIKESKSGYTSVPLDMFGNWVVYRYKIKENAKDINLNWKPKKIKENYVEVGDETLHRMAVDLKWNCIYYGINRIFFDKYPDDTVYAFTRIVFKLRSKQRAKKQHFVLKGVYEDWIGHNNDPENSKTHRAYERKE